MYIVGILAVLLVAFHFWFVHHAEELIESLVSTQSKGQLHLKVKKFKFNWFSKKMELLDAVFYSTDTINASTAYRFHVDQLRVEVKAMLPIIFEKKILIDSLHLINPDVTVTRLKSVQKASTARDDSRISIPQEMGRIYNSIQDALSVLQVSRFQIQNGRFALFNKVRPDDVPVVISNLFFRLDNLQVADTTVNNNRDKLFFSDNITLRSHHQNILFPDGRHRLAFRNFNIDIQKKIVEFDSCTISATKEDSTQNGFRVYFEKLRLTNIDFDTLYQNEVIKADSVYCYKPRFRLDVELPPRSATAKAPPKLNDLVQQLTGDLQLAIVIVEDGSFDINTLRENRPSSFTSEHNNFEMTGVRIKQSAAKPLTIDGFKMGIRNFENFLRDSSYSIQFDSILFNNNRINLSNFTYKELKNNKAVNTLSMSQFELQGISWDNLVLEQQVKAEKITLFRPTIKYHVQNKNGAGKNKDIFQTLSGIGNILLLNNLDIIEGRVQLLFDNNNELTLEQTTLSVKGEELVNANSLKSVQQAVHQLKFRKGKLKMGDMKADLGDVVFAGDQKKLKAGTLQLEMKDRVKLQASDIHIDNLLVNDTWENTKIDGLRWGKATLSLNMPPANASKKGSELLLRNINGNNTSVVITSGTRRIEGQLAQFRLDRLASIPKKPLVLDKLSTSGTNLQWKDTNVSATIGRFQLTDGQMSRLEDMHIIHHFGGEDSVDVTMPLLRLIPDVNNMINGNLYAGLVELNKPVLRIAIHQKENTGEEKGSQLPAIRLGKISVRQPDIRFISHHDDVISTISWRPKDGASFIDLNNVTNDPATGILSAKAMRFRLSDFQLSNSVARQFDAGNGVLSGLIQNIEIIQQKDSLVKWTAKVTNLEATNFTLDSIGKKMGRLELQSAVAQDLLVQSSSIKSMYDLVKDNQEFQLKDVTGSYVNNDIAMEWVNAGYDNRSKSFMLDSFAYRPTQEPDAFMQAQTSQTDYITVSTGKLLMGPFDIRPFVRDTILDIGRLNINNLYLSSYRDKRLPFGNDLIRPLPVTLIRSIPFKVSMDSITVNDSHIDYIEYNEKTKQKGTIPVSQFNASIRHLRNFSIDDNDSLDIVASAKIMDSLSTQLHLRESYADSLNGFLMDVRIGPADLTILNPVLIPLASAELKSGYLDSLNMTVVGREYLAFGEMQMHYHDLKIRLVPKGDRQRKTVLSNVVGFLANTILIKNNNHSRKGTVFFKRLRNRSAINYLVKITLSGVMSSVGVKKNKKQIKKYKKELQKNNLPPIELPKAD